MSNQTVSSCDLQELSKAMMAFVDGAGDQSLYLLKLMKLLLYGRPVPPERIASALQVSQDEVSVLLQAAERDKEGNVVGMGLSLVPTPHVYRIDGRQFYVWCAADAIMFSLFFKTNAVIESPDPISGEKVRLVATPEGVQELKPDTAVVSHVSATESIENVRAWFCDVTHFFASAETASRYVSQHPGLLIMPVDVVFQLWRRVWEREPYQSAIAGI